MSAMVLAEFRTNYAEQRGKVEDTMHAQLEVQLQKADDL